MAANLDPDLRSAIRHAAIDHIRTHGRAEWRLLYDRFPKVSDRTIRRIASQVDATEPESDLERTIGQLQQATAPPVVTSRDIASASVRGMDLIGKWHTVWNGTERQLRHALDDDGRIRNIELHNKTETLRGKLIAVGTRLAASIYTIERMERTRHQLLEAVRRADPETAERIIRELRDMDYGVSG